MENVIVDESALFRDFLDMLVTRVAKGNIEAFIANPDYFFKLEGNEYTIKYKLLFADRLDVIKNLSKFLNKEQFQLFMLYFKIGLDGQKKK